MAATRARHVLMVGFVATFAVAVAAVRALAAPPAGEKQLRASATARLAAQRIDAMLARESPQYREQPRPRSSRRGLFRERHLQRVLLDRDHARVRETIEIHRKESPSDPRGSSLLRTITRDYVVDAKGRLADSVRIRSSDPITGRPVTKSFGPETPLFRSIDAELRDVQFQPGRIVLHPEHGRGGILEVERHADGRVANVAVRHYPNSKGEANRNYRPNTPSFAALEALRADVGPRYTHAFAELQARFGALGPFLDQGELRTIGQGLIPLRKGMLPAPEDKATIERLLKFAAQRKQSHGKSLEGVTIFERLLMRSALGGRAKANHVMRGTIDDTTFRSFVEAAFDPELGRIRPEQRQALMGRRLRTFARNHTTVIFGLPVNEGMLAWVAEQVERDLDGLEGLAAEVNLTPRVSEDEAAAILLDRARAQEAAAAQLKQAGRAGRTRRRRKREPGPRVPRFGPPVQRELIDLMVQPDRALRAFAAHIPIGVLGSAGHGASLGRRARAAARSGRLVFALEDRRADVTGAQQSNDRAGFVEAVRRHMSGVDDEAVPAVDRGVERLWPRATPIEIDAGTLAGGELDGRLRLVAERTGTATYAFAGRELHLAGPERAPIAVPTGPLLVHNGHPTPLLMRWLMARGAWTFGSPRRDRRPSWIAGYAANLKAVVSELSQSHSAGAHVLPLDRTRKISLSAHGVHLGDRLIVPAAAMKELWFLQLLDDLHGFSPIASASASEAVHSLLTTLRGTRSSGRGSTVGAQRVAEALALAKILHDRGFSDVELYRTTDVPRGSAPGSLRLRNGQVVWLADGSDEPRVVSQVPTDDPRRIYIGEVPPTTGGRASRLREALRRVRATVQTE